MPNNVPLTTQDIIDLRKDVRLLAVAIDQAATTEDLDMERHRRRRTVGLVIAGGTAVLLLVVGAFFWNRHYDNHRINDNNRRIAEISQVCTTFVAAHNGLVNDDVETLKVALNEHAGIDPNAQVAIQARIDAYLSHLVNVQDCEP
jgi:hypothetical protein